MQTATYRIDATPKPSASHWEHMRDVADHLAHTLEDMAAIVRIAREEATPQDFERLDIDPADHIEGMDHAYELLDGFALEIRAAHWDDNSYADGPARVLFVLGTGGPHVELDVLCNSQGNAESVELRRYWSETDQARTTDSRALSIVDDFLSLTIAE
jgi:hypothetical protein